MTFQGYINTFSLRHGAYCLVPLTQKPTKDWVNMFGLKFRIQVELIYHVPHDKLTQKLGQDSDPTTETVSEDTFYF